MTNRTRVLFAALTFAGTAAVFGGGESMPPRMPVNATFQRMKALVGDWKGATHDGGSTTVSYSLVADGSAIMERMKPTGPDGATEEMISMYAPDGDGVMMTHYCSMHNQPRMRASASESGPIAFHFVDATNLATPDSAHMDHVTLTMDGDRMSQAWTFKTAGKEQDATFTYTRVK